MVRAFLSSQCSTPRALPRVGLLSLVCAVVLLAACDDMGSEATWAPFASPAAPTADSTAIAPLDSGATTAGRAGAAEVTPEVPAVPVPTAAAPVDAVPALITDAEPIAWSDTAWPAAPPGEPVVDPAARGGAAGATDESPYTKEEAAARIAEAAAVLDARPQIPADVRATAARQDTLVDNLSDEARAAYEEPSLADDNRTGASTPPAPDGSPDPARLSLDMVIDETRSTQGRDFYNIFYRNWQAPEGAMNYTVYVREQPGRGRGSVVEVRVNDEIAFRSQLQPRYDMIEQTAHQAVRFTQQFMQRVDVSRRIY